MTDYDVIWIGTGQATGTVIPRLGTMDGVDFFADYASFVSDHEVRVGDQTISGDTIVLHTGTRPFAVPINGLDEVDCRPDLPTPRQPGDDRGGGRPHLCRRRPVNDGETFWDVVVGPERWHASRAVKG